MSLNSTPTANRIHIGFFGKRNAGKSSIVNAVTGQQLSIVSDTKGTTTDPVFKSLELLPLGPVTVIDTAGFDDEGELGSLRIQKTMQILNKTDIAILVVDALAGLDSFDKQLIDIFEKKSVPYCIVYNKSDLLESVPDETDKTIYVSAVSNYKIYELKEKITKIIPQDTLNKRIVADLINPLDLVILVIPIDESAPKGRLILPQQQIIRDILEIGACALTVKDTEFKDIISTIGKKPALVITDSQVFGKISAECPDDIPLTSFSILLARFKGYLETAVKGVKAIETLADNDTVLISEGCTHHRQCNDIGTVKLPKLLTSYTNKKLNFEFTSGNEFPQNVSKYSLIIHCGGCMLNEREVKYRMNHSVSCNIPFTNYGTAIAYMNGILKKSLVMPEFKDII